MGKREMKEKQSLIFEIENIEDFKDLSPEQWEELARYARYLKWEDKSEINRELQRKGIERAKRQGKYKGRQAREIDVDKFRHECELWRAGKQTAEEAAEHTGYKRAMFFRKVKEFGF